MTDIYGARGRKLKQDGLGAMADPRFYRGPTAHILDNAIFPNGSLIGEKCYLGEVPSRAVIMPSSKFYNGAFGTNCTLNIGDALDDDALATLVAVSSGGNSPLVEHISNQNIVKPLWELLGYAADPDRMIDLYASIAGANVSTTTAWLTWEIYFGRG